MGMTVFVTFVCVFLATAILEKILIPLLKRLKMGQKILEIGPSWHMSKQGTPTMGGLAFLLTVTAAALVIMAVSGVDTPLLLTSLYALSNGLIGIIDDLMKLKRKQNEGLSATAKFLLQLGFAAAFVVLLSVNGVVYTELYIPFLKRTVYIGRLYYPFALVFLTGFTNAVNLTDGLDGLCTSVSAVVSMLFALLAINAGDIFGAVMPVALLAGALGFLIYNFYPAKVFMGDTGSLFLGGAISGLALVSGKATLLLIVGGVYLLEAVSVILQVLYYKLTKKRLFLMAPFHHHLEKKGVSEISIVFIFTAVTLVLAAVAYMFA